MTPARLVETVLLVAAASALGSLLLWIVAMLVMNSPWMRRRQAEERARRWARRQCTLSDVLNEREN